MQRTIRSMAEVRRGVAERVVGRVRETDLLLAAIGAGRDVLLEGPPGTSKSTLLGAITAELGSPLMFVEGNADLTPARLVGYHDPARVLSEGYHEDNFVPGPLVAAMRDGGVLYLEEFNRSPEDTLNSLLTAMAERRITVPRVGTVVADPAFRVVASMNPFDNIGTVRLSMSVHDRFCRLSVGYQDTQAEHEIVVRRTGCGSARLVADAVALTRATREHPDLRGGSSVRGAIDLTLVAMQLFDMRGGCRRSAGLDRSTAGSSGGVHRRCARRAAGGAVRTDRGRRGLRNHARSGPAGDLAGPFPSPSCCRRPRLKVRPRRGRRAPSCSAPLHRPGKAVPAQTEAAVGRPGPVRAPRWRPGSGDGGWPASSRTYPRIGSRRGTRADRRAGRGIAAGRSRCLRSGRGRRGPTPGTRDCCAAVRAAPTTSSCAAEGPRQAPDAAVSGRCRGTRPGPHRRDTCRGPVRTVHGSGDAGSDPRSPESGAGRRHLRFHARRAHPHRRGRGRCRGRRTRTRRSGRGGLLVRSRRSQCPRGAGLPCRARGPAAPDPEQGSDQRRLRARRGGGVSCGTYLRTRDGYCFCRIACTMPGPIRGPRPAGSPGSTCSPTSPVNTICSPPATSLGPGGDSPCPSVDTGMSLQRSRVHSAPDRPVRACLARDWSAT